MRKFALLPAMAGTAFAQVDGAPTASRTITLSPDEVTFSVTENVAPVPIRVSYSVYVRYAAQPR
jgi:hypothetical protein